MKKNYELIRLLCGIECKLKDIASDFKIPTSKIEPLYEAIRNLKLFEPRHIETI